MAERPVAPLYENSPRYRSVDKLVSNMGAVGSPLENSGNLTGKPKGTENKGSIYDAGPTFESHGVPHGSAVFANVGYGSFLGQCCHPLVWGSTPLKDNVCVETADGIKHCRLIVVHAGLEKDKDVKQQLAFLKARDTRVPKIEALSGRKNVWDIPKELIEKPIVVVSGHHAKLNIEGLRLIIDEGGGMAERPVAAVVLPSMKIVRDTDALTN
ncbi:unnamed protein product [Malus baccata var. baccata]